MNNRFSSCSCPDYAQRRSVCKHMMFIIGRIAQDQSALFNMKSDVHNIFDIKKNLTEVLVTRLHKRIETQKPPLTQPTKETESEMDDCCICFEELTLTSTPKNLLSVCFTCKHFFHKSCMDRWISIKKTCPLCRQLILEEISKYDNDELKFFKN